MSTQHKSPPRISKVRLAGFIALAVYPLVTFLLYGVMEVTPGWPIWERTLLLCPFIVVAMVWGIIPAIHKYFGHLIVLKNE